MISNINEKPTIIDGGDFSDNRGILRYVNAFKFEGVKRFYLIKHPNKSIVRAWQGHQYEKKYFYPISSTFVVAWVKIDDFDNPSQSLIPDYHILSAKKSEIVAVPKGYANGLKALESNSEIIVFSDMNSEESIKEKKCYPAGWWFDWENIDAL